MVEHVPVSVHYNNSDVFFKSETGLLIRITNTVVNVAERLWAETVENDTVYFHPDVNESTAYLEKPWKYDLNEPVATDGYITIIESSDEESYILGYSDNAPIYRPYYFFAEETDSVYSVRGGMANTNFDGDSVLGLSEKENIYQVTNQQTGYTQPISSDEITEKIGTEYQYALPIQCDF